MMTNLVKYSVLIALAVMSLISCDSGKSLQRYLVDKQEDDRYIRADIATSLFLNDENNFSAEEMETLKTIKKINVVAYLLKKGNESEYESEKSILKEIINQEQYQTLGSFKSNEIQMTLKYLGEETSIDEVVIFASSSDKGFGVFRLLCDNMRPDQALKLMSTMQRGDLDLSKLSGMSELFSSL
jgi:hypothetical protein